MVKMLANFCAKSGNFALRELKKRWANFHFILLHCRNAQSVPLHSATRSDLIRKSGRAHFPELKLGEITKFCLIIFLIRQIFHFMISARQSQVSSRRELGSNYHFSSCQAFFHIWPCKSPQFSIKQISKLLNVWLCLPPWKVMPRKDDKLGLRKCFWNSSPLLANFPPG